MPDVDLADNIYEDRYFGEDSQASDFLIYTNRHNFDDFRVDRRLCQILRM